jgi:hypothetical protein
MTPPATTSGPLLATIETAGWTGLIGHVEDEGLVRLGLVDR